MTRARQVANFDPALFAADEVSGDKVSGGSIGAGVIGGSVTGGAGLTGSTSLGTVTSGTFNGVLGDSYTTSDKYYCQAKLNSSYALSGDEMINTTGTTDPYWSYTGDTTNIIGVNNHDIKLVRAGVYQIIFSATFHGAGSLEARHVHAMIRGVGSESASNLAGGYDQIADVGSSDYGNLTVSLVRSFEANDLINFFAGPADAIAVTLNSHTHASICLIRPT